MPNRLINEISPYLLQHAHNPVDWYPWGQDALAAAQSRDVPIFLSIGYSSCHWCHVMERESFENEDTARLLNENFVAIKVDPGRAPRHRLRLHGRSAGTVRSRRLASERVPDAGRFPLLWWHVLSA